MPGGYGQEWRGNKNDAGHKRGANPKYGRTGSEAQPRNHENGKSRDSGGGGEGVGERVQENRTKHCIICEDGLMAPGETTWDHANGGRVARGYRPEETEYM